MSVFKLLWAPSTKKKERKKEKIIIMAAFHTHIQLSWSVFDFETYIILSAFISFYLNTHTLLGTTRTIPKTEILKWFSFLINYISERLSDYLDVDFIEGIT